MRPEIRFQYPVNAHGGGLESGETLTGPDLSSGGVCTALQQDESSTQATTVDLGITSP
ncbi:hypothetical protein PF005_g25002 [Phytophthora fragariae]|uniref:Uncharacterized protein n=1 Tax=Phytophthora fragariae TaxID=53985 RepID=A0A6A4BW59_9STRA|nr:hypothetical protein PF003_g7165 [Phytophthora fragariae]KAE8928551.1 hypothetical protein PF009_g21311 [Phytophthora fragariae]KAE8984285.1 hypothetical protein PF011_g20840 [Phytophthora fragariae]KAE9074734.1 hypothetical protein PF010_g24565 [Phytophthora fragariae]KAE9080356.1 hypothetical protein PF007_g23082 [Phytophthora fragariae]